MRVKHVLITCGLIVAFVASGILLGAVSTSYAGSKSPDPTYCDSYAKDYADRNTNTAGNVVGGAVGGAATGALVGGIVGGGRGAGKGAAIGAGAGAVGGGIRASQAWNDNYHRAYNSCMDRRY